MGALDAKPPNNGGPPYFNYKGFHSIVLMALVDADYFIWVDIGANGFASDAAKVNHSEMKEAIENSSIDFLATDPLPNDDRPMPYLIIGADAFPLRTWLMKPFPRRNLPDA